MKVTGGYHGTMRHRAHAEGFHALSAPHISTSVPHTQDPPPFKSTTHRKTLPPLVTPLSTHTHRSSEAAPHKTTTEQNMPTTLSETSGAFAFERPINHNIVLSVTIMASALQYIKLN